MVGAEVDGRRAMTPTDLVIATLAGMGGGAVYGVVSAIVRAWWRARR